MSDKHLFCTCCMPGPIRIIPVIHATGMYRVLCARLCWNNRTHLSANICRLPAMCKHCLSTDCMPGSGKRGSPGEEKSLPLTLPPGLGPLVSTLLLHSRQRVKNVGAGTRVTESPSACPLTGVRPGASPFPSLTPSVKRSAQQSACSSKPTFCREGN